ncbi:MAG TPA: LCP family protein [Acidimicrobiia bacterium]|nr:LCP family protein [Acidimicrobiia bacterium]
MTHPVRTQTQPTRRRRYSRGQRWFLRLLLLLILLVGGFLVMAFMTEGRMEDAGELGALADDDGVYLIVGTDNRENLPDDLGDFFGDFAGARADVIILAQVVDGRRQLLSLPRDLKVEIPGNGTNRINAAYAFGGPDLLVETVALATGIRPQHYLEVEFGGFAAIIDALGGIEIDFPYPARDEKSGLSVDAGLRVVDGPTALAYARSRTYEELRDGEWVGAGGGDIARTGRQREVLLKIMSKASSPAGLVRSPLAMTAVGSHLTADSNTTVLTLVRTGWSMRTASITDSISLPVAGSNEGGVSYVVAVQPEATQVLEAFAVGAPLPGGEG